MTFSQCLIIIVFNNNFCEFYNYFIIISCMFLDELNLRWDHVARITQHFLKNINKIKVRNWYKQK